MTNTACDNHALATRLALAAKRLRARLREESNPRTAELSISQQAILQQLLHNGPATAASLAAAEHVSQQAIAQTVSYLKSAGLVKSEPDPKDGRKSLISLTAAGFKLHESIVGSRNDWLARAIGSTIGADERAVLDEAIKLLERLADAEC